LSKGCGLGGFSSKALDLDESQTKGGLPSATAFIFKTILRTSAKRFRPPSFLNSPHSQRRPCPWASILSAQGFFYFLCLTFAVDKYNLVVKYPREKRHQVSLIWPIWGLDSLAGIGFQVGRLFLKEKRNENRW